jgi:hypothetical protein
MESFHFESKKEKPELINAFELSENQESTLRYIIEKNHGAIRVFIHPFYPQGNMNLGELGNIDPKDHEVMQKGFSKLIEIQDNEQTPLFIFEEDKRIPELTSKIGDVIGRNIYIIPTLQDTSAPYYKESMSDDANMNQSPKLWEDLSKIFRDWGVERITLGGQSMAIDFDEEDSSPYSYDGCAGLAYQKLKNNFNIEISRFSYPMHRKEFNSYVDIIDSSD